MTTALNSDTRCCIVGGGSAGMMLGYLLARAMVRRLREAGGIPVQGNQLN